MKVLPRWLFLVYARLWVKKKDSWFTFQEAQKITGIKKLLKLSKAFSLMKSAGWIEAKKNKDNPRTRMYKLVSFDKVLNEIGK